MLLIITNKIRFIIIFIISILFVLLPSISNAQNYKQISQIAREITVLIDGCNSGSGVIYKREKNTYSILTAKHIFDNSTIGCLVIAPDGKRYRINENNIITPISGVDLAIVSFDSNQNYKQAKFGSSQQADTSIYIAGAPAPSTAIPQRTIIVTPGNIVGKQRPHEGYELIYSNATKKGMSGGPVLNEQGKVIGIHGQGDREDGDKTGLNLAIPIETFLKANSTDLPKRKDPSITKRKVPNNSTVKRDLLRENKKVNFQTLESALKNQRWKEANDITFKLILQLAGRKYQGWITKKHLEKISCNDIAAIDRLWVKYSNGKFGFSVQQSLFNEKVKNAYIYDLNTNQSANNLKQAYKSFLDRIGYTKKFGFTKKYEEFYYDLNVPQGHLPVLTIITDNPDVKKTSSILELFFVPLKLLIGAIIWFSSVIFTVVFLVAFSDWFNKITSLSIGLFAAVIIVAIVIIGSELIGLGVLRLWLLFAGYFSTFLLAPCSFIAPFLAWIVSILTKRDYYEITSNDKTWYFIVSISMGIAVVIVFWIWIGNIRLGILDELPKIVRIDFLENTFYNFPLLDHCDLL